VLTGEKIFSIFFIIKRFKQRGFKMITLKHHQDRGHTQTGWLDSYHTFSFGEYYDPRNMGFSDLRVINDDVVKPGKGFGTHGHQDMEIVTVVLSGALEHKDSMGNGSIIRPGDVQRMSAGTGVTHSEFNPSDTEPVHLLQIWILPECQGLEPSYEQRSFASREKRECWRLIASPDGHDSSVTVHQDVEIYETLINAHEELTYEIPSNRKAWLHVATGIIELNNQVLEAGDGIGITESEYRLAIEGLNEQSEVLLFNLK
jgi:quercetin 2,3-dioxygenase